MTSCRSTLLVALLLAQIAPGLLAAEPRSRGLNNARRQTIRMARKTRDALLSDLTSPLPEDVPLSEKLIAPYVRDLPTVVKGKRIRAAEPRDKLYLRTLIAGVRASLGEVFVPWTRSHQHFSADFKTMLVEQHARMNEGGYLGYHSTFESLGFFGRPSLRKGTRLDLGVRHPLEFRLEDWQINQVQENLGPLAIDGIPAVAWPRNDADPWQRGVYNHIYPAAEHEQFYIERMARLMKTALKQVAAKDSAATIDTLARYYHVAANSHLFERANNSLFMGQINYLLVQVGKKPISHGQLDYLAMILPTQQFLEVFRSAVGKANRSLAKP